MRDIVFIIFSGLFSLLCEQTVVEESEDVNQSNLSALVEVIRSAGFHVTENQKQIVITDGGEELAFDGSVAEQDIVYEDAEHIMLNEAGDPVEMVMDDASGPVQYVIQEAEEMVLSSEQEMEDVRHS